MKRLLTYLVPSVLAAALAVMAVLYADAYEKKQRAEQALNTRVAALYHAVATNLSDMDGALSKLDAASSREQHIQLLCEVWRQSGSAQTALCEVPSSHADTYETTQFLTRVGDYAYALIRQTLSGRPLSADDRAQLTGLRERCGVMQQAMLTAMETGALPEGQLADGGYYEQARDDSDIPDYPHLIYDGPFSESSEGATPPGLSGDPVDEQMAAEIAREIFPDAELSYDGVCDGQVQTHEFTVTSGEETFSLSITCTGGHLWNFMGSPTSDRSDPPSDEESEKLHRAAEAFLSELGYGQMHPSYAQYYAGTVVLNYAALESDVILYSDLIKVYVDRETEKVIGLDAAGYVKNHRPRTLPAPAISEEEARQRVSERISVESSALALIPRTNTTEVLCYEYKGTLSDAYYIVYINAETGAEEQIFEVINSDEGDLVI